MNGINMRSARMKSFFYTDDLIWLLDDDSKCSKVINLNAAKSYVNILNEKLNITCPNFRINIDYIFGLPEYSIINTYSNLVVNGRDADSLLLCLFHNNNCVSSLTMTIDGDKISIDSKTNSIYEGRKFNKLLRAVLIIIAKSLNENIHFITSEAINPISAYLMINSFNATATNYENETLIIPNSEDIDYEENLKTILKNEIKKNDFLFLKVELNEPNIQKAQQVFDTIIDNIDCTEPETTIIGGNKKRKRTKKKIIKKIIKRIRKEKPKDDNSIDIFSFSIN